VGRGRRALGRLRRLKKRLIGNRYDIRLDGVPVCRVRTRSDDLSLDLGSVLISPDGMGVVTIAGPDHPKEVRVTYQYVEGKGRPCG